MLLSLLGSESVSNRNSGVGIRQVGTERAALGLALAHVKVGISKLGQSRPWLFPEPALGSGIIIRASDSDLDLFFTDPDPGFFPQSGSGSWIRATKN